MASQAPGSVFEVVRSNLAYRKLLDVEKEAKSLPTFAGDKQSKEEILLHNCLNFVQAVQDAVDRYEWQEADVFIAVTSQFTSFASAWFRDWRLNQAVNLIWRQLSQDFLLEFSGVRSQHQATEIYRDSRQGEHELIRLFIARKELLASLAGVDRASPSGQLGIVVVVLQTLNSRCSGLRAFYTEQAGRLDGSRPLAELQRVVDEY
jgi:hypothetical protein